MCRLKAPGEGVPQRNSLSPKVELRGVLPQVRPLNGHIKLQKLDFKL